MTTLSERSGWNLGDYALASFGLNPVSRFQRFPPLPLSQGESEVTEQFTPGPWRLSLSMSHKVLVYAEGSPVAVAAAEAPANARLIAAAPELYEALEKVTDSLEAELQARYPIEAEGHSPYPEMKRRFDRDMAEVIEARAIIAKARGQQ